MPSWLDRFDWLVFNEKVMYCKVCNHEDLAHRADKEEKLFIGTDKFRIEPLKSHDKNPAHVTLVRAYNKILENKKETDNETENNNLNEKSGPMDILKSQLDERKRKQIDNLFSCSYYIAANNKPAGDMSELCNLIEKTGGDIGNMYRNNQACTKFIEAISDVFCDELKSELSAADYLSLLSDGSTDVTVKEQESVWIRFVSKQTGKCETKFVTLSEPTNGTSGEITKAILAGCKNIGIGYDSLKKKLICVNLDGATVNQGDITGVGKQLSDVAHPVCCSFWCGNHKLELAVMDAMKSPTNKNKKPKQSSTRGCAEDPENDIANVLAEVEEVVELVYKFYYGSAKRRKGLRSICEVLEEDPAYLAGYSSTRWAASRLRSFKAILEHFSAIVMHLENMQVDEDCKDKGTTSFALIKD